MPLPSFKSLSSRGRLWTGPASFNSAGELYHAVGNVLDGSKVAVKQPRQYRLRVAHELVALVAWQGVRNVEVPVGHTYILGHAARWADNLDYLAMHARLRTIRAPAGRPDHDVIAAAHHAEAANEVVQRIEHSIGHRLALPIS